MIRQGDILFIPIKPEDGQTQYMTKQEKGVVAEGEATGHHHRIAEVDLANAELFKSWRGVEGAILSVGEKGISIVHEEHQTVTLAPNTTYRVHQAREYDYFSNLARRVRD
jgi:hypothetical protein